MRDEDTVGAHARGFNAISLGVCYEGGLDEDGKAADTRTSHQKESLHRLVRELLQRYPDAKVVGHRDLSPDTNLRVENGELRVACALLYCMVNSQFSTFSTN